MVDGLIRWSLENRIVVVVAAVVLVVWGSWQAWTMNVDVLPDLTAPTVSVVVEAHGMAPEEVETQVLRRLEPALNGASGVRRVRSTAGIGNAVVRVDFDWGTDIYRARQIVSERLQVVRTGLPPEVEPPTIAPLTSIMGEIMFVAVVAEEGADVGPMELRTSADWTIRRRLESVPGVAKVSPIGGDVRQYQAVVDPDRLAAHDIAVSEVLESLEHSGENTSAGFYRENGREYLIYGVGRYRTPSDIATTKVAVREGRTVTVGDLAEVRVGSALKRGAGSYNGSEAVIVGIQKQPGANTLDLTRRLDGALDELDAGLPDGVELRRDAFRQAAFIERAVDNVADALRDGAILVVIVILLFLANVRSTLITATAIPLSLLAALLVLEALGGSINTMTLGGMAIAVGAIVDDAIVDVENVVRRLRENARRPEGEQQPVLEVVFEASSEIRNAIVYATLVIALVFVPLFFLTGVEGRLLEPLGIAYIAALMASLLVALTVTPVLCFYLLPNSKGIRERERGRLLQWLERRYQSILDATVDRWRLVGGVALASFAAAVAGFLFAGQAFLPEFNEGSLTIGATTLPGTALETSDELGARVEEVLLEHPEVSSTSRRTGRAERSEHAQGVYSAEIDVELDLGERERADFLRELREDLASVPGMNITIGQPISHRIDHMLSGTRADVAVKIFGGDLQRLRSTAESVESAIDGVEGVVDLNVSRQVDVPYLRIDFDRQAIAEHGASLGEVSELVETAFRGRVVSQVVRDQRAFDILVRFDEEAKRDVEAIRSTPVATPGGGHVPLEALAEIRRDRAPNRIERENAERKIVVSSNVAGSDLVGTVDEIRRRIRENVDIPTGYHVEYGGQYDSATRATRMIGFLTLLVVVGIFVLLYVPLGSGRDAALVMSNLPLALIGGVAGVYVTGGVVSIAELIGFVTLFGIATRNGLLMVARIQAIAREQPKVTVDEAVERGAIERLAPITMTALASGLGLVPLAMKMGAPGGEIQGPMAVVILCGLVSSTILNMIVVPALYKRFGEGRNTER